MSLIKPVGKLSAEDVITVYRNDYDARLFEALGKNYEGTWLLMGDEDFTRLGAEYVRLNPSRFTNLTVYGDKFCEFLRSSDVDDMLLEMALFEKNFWEIFHLPPKKARALTAEDLQTETFDFEAGIYLSQSSLRLHELWLLREGGSEGRELDDFMEEEYLTLYKCETGVKVLPISETQFQILNLIRESENLSQVFVKLDTMNIETTQEEWTQIFGILSYR